MIGAAIKVAKIATGEIEDARDEQQSAPAELDRKDGKARAAKLSKNQRVEIDRKAAAKRWEF